MRSDRTAPLYVKFIKTHGFAETPQQAYRGDAGFDLAACERTQLLPGVGRDIPTGIKCAIPEGHFGLIVGRSSMLRKRGLLVQLGVIDAEYRGELFVYAHNLNQVPVTIEAGERVGQIIVLELPFPAEFLLQATLPPGVRGERGFGSSGK